MKNKEKIKRILIEYMESKLNDWENNISDFGNVVGVLISDDNETGEKFYLFVGFNERDDGYMEYTYSFMLLDKDDKPLTDFLMKRDEVKRYMPSDLIGKRQIFPIIINLTRKLLNNMLPEKILRRTKEKVYDKSLTRYEEITNIMVNEYNYVVVQEGTTSFGTHYWKLEQNGITNKNKTMEEQYIIEDLPTNEDTLRGWNEKLPMILEGLKKTNNSNTL